MHASPNFKTIKAKSQSSNLKDFIIKRPVFRGNFGFTGFSI